MKTAFTLLLIGCACSFGQTFQQALTDNGTRIIRVEGGNLVTNEIVTLSDITNVSQSVAAFYIAVNATIYQSTNWVSGKPYTNNTSRNVQVSSVCTNTPALILGNAGHVLRVGANTNSANTLVKSICNTPTLLALLVPAAGGDLRATIPPGGYWFFTNITSGAGNVSTVDGGEIVSLP